MMLVFLVLNKSHGMAALVDPTLRGVRFAFWRKFSDGPALCAPRAVEVCQEPHRCDVFPPSHGHPVGVASSREATDIAREVVSC